MIRRLFLFLLTLALVFSAAHAQALPETVRLHVVAQGDGVAAQQFKLEMRDVCLDLARICLADARSADEAYSLLVKHLPAFQAALDERARELGYGGAISAETGVFEFPDRIYGELKVPAGEYRALRVVIGAGGGHNWWCVLYPSLCVLDEADYASGEKYYSKVLNWIRERIGGWL